MIGLAMTEWPDDALRRVVDAPIGKWRPEWLNFDDGSACLLGHAVPDADGHGDPRFEALGFVVYDPDDSLYDQVEVFGDRFDDLCRRFTIPRAVRAIKSRALRILLQRHPMEPVTPALTECRVSREGA